VVILDPVTSVLSISRNNADDVRAVLTGLGNLAARYGIAIIAVVHLNKSGRGQAISQVSGSFEWTAACRAAFLVTHDSDGGRHLFLPLPNNVGLKREGLAFHVEEVPVNGAAGVPAALTRQAAHCTSAPRRFRYEAASDALAVAAKIARGIALHEL
jgi:AAA domain